MIVRPERPFDFDAIDDVVGAAFDNPGDPEVRLVHQIRANGGYVPQFSLVADDFGEIVGHIMLSYVALGERRVLQLSPLAVKPSRQNEGIGDALSRDAIMRADEGLEPLVLVLGHPNYYPRFGFVPARSLGIEPPDEAITDGPWMARKLANYDPSLTGRVDFGPAFELD
jgi:putative acetyltransferase